MILRGLIAGGAKDWAAALALADNARGKRRLPLREQNFILDNLAAAQDAEAEARAAAKRLTMRRLPRLSRP
jgi:hypothetical protein